MSEPGFWRNEISGALRPAIEALLLETGPLSEAHIAAIRTYLRQWIMAPAWCGSGVTALRETIDDLTSREVIERWLDVASEYQIDPL